MNKSKLKIDNPASPKDIPGVEQSNADPESSKDDSGQSPNHSRKPALSKREIMEELSRARFPWDE